MPAVPRVPPRRPRDGLGRDRPETCSPRRRSGGSGLISVVVRHRSSSPRRRPALHRSYHAGGGTGRAPAAVYTASGLPRPELRTLHADHRPPSRLRRRLPWIVGRAASWSAALLAWRLGGRASRRRSSRPRHRPRRRRRAGHRHRHPLGAGHRAGRQPGVGAHPAAVRRLQLAGEEGPGDRARSTRRSSRRRRSRRRPTTWPAQGNLAKAAGAGRGRDSAQHERARAAVRAQADRRRRTCDTARGQCARRRAASVAAARGQLAQARGRAAPGAGEPHLHRHRLADRRHRDLAQRRRRADGRRVAVRRRCSSRSPRT